MTSALELIIFFSLTSTLAEAPSKSAKPASKSKESKSGTSVEVCISSLLEGLAAVKPSSFLRTSFAIDCSVIFSFSSKSSQDNILIPHFIDKLHSLDQVLSMLQEPQILDSQQQR